MDDFRFPINRPFEERADRSQFTVVHDSDFTPLRHE
jgi:hypothetical protein